MIFQPHTRCEMNVSFSAQPELESGKDMDGSYMEVPTGNWLLFAVVRDDANDVAYEFVNEMVFKDEETAEKVAALYNANSETVEKAKTALFDGTWRAWTKVDEYPAWLLDQPEPEPAEV